ncbi:venom serine protease 34-like isoform X2 [Pseudomyrmex gracilis]|uniref:venom serine protease 34-like isoform X2 n=1 Tax=Pseudomyrmex gracilis TaxID=219809 RepID=UPI00099589A9|nr:venom serine protease 34-like isoform X2 [Pseudomyrmex gracilis]
MEAVKVVLFGLPIFFAVLSGVKSDCNFFQNVQPGQTYYAYNVKYPHNYEGENYCTWQVASLDVITVNCMLEMPQSYNCNADSISIQFAGSQAQKYCGFGTFELKGKTSATIKFNSPNTSSGGRFLCEIKSEKLFDEYNCPCGWKKPTRIVGGSETGVNEYTMMAGLVDKTRKEIYCGATIIDKQHVLTAAHCVENRNIGDLGVVIGEHDVTTNKETNATKVYRLSNYVIHPFYKGFSNDIAVCEIIGIIEYSAEVGPVCLPFQHQYDSFGGDIATMLGWGLEEFAGTKATTLQEANTSVISLHKCHSFNSDVTYTNICTYKLGKDACQMDSGGPILWQNPTTRNLVLIGIISGGIGCGGDSPSINTRVGAYVDWIQRVTGAEYCKVE